MKKSFEPESYESKWQKYWESKRFFVARAPYPHEKSFCIMIPPPNVTGTLHMGHALQTTLQDTLTRWKRMQGFNALWLPGTDHAGIATQLMVEKELAKEGLTRWDLGREEFLKRVWKWKDKYHDNIKKQLQRLGASCDWTREKFTLDAQLSRAVKIAFVRLYREGFIYRGEYMVNWSPVLRTAISDLEVEMRPVKGKLYYIKYPVEGRDEFVVVATTRPETMLGDTAVAVNPSDDRFSHLIGTKVILPLVGRKIPVIADERVDMEFGTGAVKVTPAHDPLDFEIGNKHNLPFIKVIDEAGKITSEGGEWEGLDRFEARERIVEALKDKGFLEKIEDYEHNVGFSQRSGEPIEPLLSRQWFLDVKEMAHQALSAVESGIVKFYPETWNKTWNHWLSNVKPWCISRQIWWGHRIPAWYDADGRVIVAHDFDEASRLAGTSELEQDPDVLDTWFSSALWPFSTLGWPDYTDDFVTFYPTTSLITGFDILFFWVARMMMMGLHFTGREPFKQVHLTGLIRDAQGQKMSKTKGNTLDPEDMIDKYGADAVRFTLAALDSPGRDIPLDEKQMAGYRAFCNKIWNAGRFILTNASSAQVKLTIDIDNYSKPTKWIFSKLSKVSYKANNYLEDFRFDEYCKVLYHFFWHEFCDWYIEFSKSLIKTDLKNEITEALINVFERSLRLLHPVIPHITEELWQMLPNSEVVNPETISLTPYPVRDKKWENELLEKEIDNLREIVTKIRNLRSLLGFPPNFGGKVYINYDGDEYVQIAVKGVLHPLSVTFTPFEGQVIRDTLEGIEFGIEIDKETVKLAVENIGKELEEVNSHIERISSLLNNNQFLAKAPKHVIESNKKRLEDLVLRKEKLHVNQKLLIEQI